MACFINILHSFDYCLFSLIFASLRLCREIRLRHFGEANSHANSIAFRSGHELMILRRILFSFFSLLLCQDDIYEFRHADRFYAHGDSRCL